MWAMWAGRVVPTMQLEAFNFLFFLTRPCFIINSRGFSWLSQVFPPPGQTEAGPARVRRPPQRLRPPLRKECVPVYHRHGDGHSRVSRHD